VAGQVVVIGKVRRGEVAGALIRLTSPTGERQ
jgi:hypothetical protein